MISGWGKFNNYSANIFKPKTLKDLKDLIKNPKFKNFISRGNGRSYGDSSINKNILSLKDLKKVIKIDVKNKIVNCTSNILLKELNEKLLSNKLFLCVSPGTQYISIGGAIASDIHGKNHHNDGSFSNHILEFQVMLADGTVKKCSKKKNSKLFYSTCGGMGLTGIILSAKFKVQDIKSNSVIQNSIKTASLKETLKEFNIKHNHKYLVAWLDMSAKNINFGRGVVYFADHGVKNVRKVKQKFKINFNFPNFFLNSCLFRILNTVFYIINKKSEKKILHMNKFFYTLDNILLWNNFYGQKGFVQIQILIKPKNALNNIKKIIKFFQFHRQYSFITTLKKMGNKNNCYLGFSEPGYTLTFDIPNNNELKDFYKQLEIKLFKIDAKTYLTKDSLMSEKYFKKTYKNYKKFINYKRLIDPRSKFISYQSLRLGIK